MAENKTKQAGKLKGETAVEFHTRDCVSLFDGFIPERKSSNTLTLSIRAFSARTNMIATHHANGDPVATECLVRIEQGFDDLIALCGEKNIIVDELIEQFKDVISTSSFSVSPVKRTCNNISVYGMYGVRCCLIMDSTIRALMSALHITVMTKAEAQNHKRQLKRKFRGILTLAFQYSPKITRDDFDAGNKDAQEKIKYYREKLYIKQDDKRDDAELMQYYASYSQNPKMV